MNRTLALTVTAALATGALASQGCYGSYSAFDKLHGWNGHATGNKIANSAIHFILLPVYGLFITGDIVIFNNIEFFTGSPVFK